MPLAQGCCWPRLLRHARAWPDCTTLSASHSLAFISAKVPPYTALEQMMWSPLLHSASSVAAMALMPAWSIRRRRFSRATLNQVVCSCAGCGKAAGRPTPGHAIRPQALQEQALSKQQAASGSCSPEAQQ